MHDPPRSLAARLHSALPWLALLAIWLWLFGDVVFGRASLIRPSSEHLLGVEYAGPQPPVMGEPWNLTGVLPASVHFARALRAGGFYQFDATVGTGHPLLADLQQRPFGLGNVLAVVLPPAQALSLAHALLVLLGLAGAVALFGRLGASPVTALVLALAAALLAYPVIKTSTGTWFAPWVLHAALRHLERSTRGPAAEVLWLTAAAWNGHPSSAILVALLWAVFWLACPGPARLRERIAAVAWGSALTLLAVAPLVLPYLLNASALISYRELVYQPVGLSWRDLVTPGRLVPLSGLVALLLAPVVATNRPRVVVFLGGTGIFAALLVIGSNAGPPVLGRLVSLYYAVALLPLLLGMAVASAERGVGAAASSGRIGLVLGVGLSALALAAAATGDGGARWAALLDAVLVATAVLLAGQRRRHAFGWSRHLGVAHRGLVAIAIAATSVLATTRHVDRAPPMDLVAEPPLARLDEPPTTRHRVIVCGGPAWEHPLPPNLLGLWGYQDLAQNSATFAALYAAGFVEVFGRPHFPTFFIPRQLPQRDPAVLGVGAVFLFHPREHRFDVARTGGVIASWRASGALAAQPLDGYRQGFAGLWQTFTWQLPAEARDHAGSVEIKFTPLVGFRYDSSDGSVHPFDPQADHRWLVAPTALGQHSFVARYREDGFWLGLLASLASLVLCLRPWTWRRRAR